MKILFALLLLIGSAKGQTTGLTFDTVGNVPLQMFEIGKNPMSGSWYFIVQDSLGRIVARQKDDEHLVVEDSGATITVMYKCLQSQYEWEQKQWAKRDTVKWKPYYQKKKHHPHNTASWPQWGGPLPDSLRLDSIALDHGYFQNGVYHSRAGGGNFHENTRRSDCDPPMAGCRYDSSGYEFIYDWTTWHTIYPINAVTSTKWVRDTLFSEKGYGPSYNEPYPWWKKALWVLLGIFIAAIIFVIVEVTQARDMFRFKDPYPPNYDQLHDKMN